MMMKTRSILLQAIIILLLAKNANGQQAENYKSWNPATDTVNAVEGRAWPKEVANFYDRLPARAEKTVRSDVWNLSRNSAGLQLRFQTNAADIIVKYTVSGGLQMPHMPATGVSGVDLYSKTIDGKWLWAAGQFSFGDTIVYRFTSLPQNDQHVKNREYTLYLPLYSTVKWMEISVPEISYFKPLPVRTEQPVVVYGTSIAQGACATRAGLAWTNMLGRKLERPVINLGFSGNGRLEKELAELLVETDAKLFVLDCLPNLTEPYFSKEEIKKRIVETLNFLLQKKPNTPVLLTEHDGFGDEGLNQQKYLQYTGANKIQRAVFDSFVAAGRHTIYLLTKTEINQGIETMIDGVHPNDIGMLRYGDAYEKKIREIFDEHVGTVSTAIPITQRRDANTYDWETKHNQVLAYNKMQQPKLIFIGNSITHFWGGMPDGPRKTGQDSWDKYFTPLNAVNMGYGWDRIENVLWRVQHGELDNFSAHQIVIMIGTNNLQYNSNEEIVQGLQVLINAIQQKQPAAKILLLGILPRRDMEKRIVELNKLIASGIQKSGVKYVDAGVVFLKKDARIDESFFNDGLHPNAVGYEKLGGFISSQLSNK